ncbi:hypothetical protein FB45DRAFT_1026268 [Roridomyces roridus]|uniref:DUF6699 domain-containing protein n=1 Tax=Roridomyces roridus TaxID=1738132 RepID=A0AAD7C239_9AGAR|nr:hypothetical protein FB45DRAFT_1026268 [Roridomyces roridus]
MLPRTVRFNPDTDEIQRPNRSQSASSSSNDESGPTLPRMNSLLLQGTCPPLDFSVPSVALQADRRLSPEVMSKPACNPPQTHAVIRVAAATRPDWQPTPGLCKFHVSHQPPSEPITVGDVLNAIHYHLRQPGMSQQSLPRAEVERYHAHRVCTVDECLRRISDPVKRMEVKNGEETKGVRVVDGLCGAVCFNGVSIQSPELWHVNLLPSERYANVASGANSG